MLPDGQLLRNISGTRLAAADYTRHFYGAAQVQVITAPGLSDAERDAVISELVGGHLELIQALLGQD